MFPFAPATSDKPYRILFEHRPQYLFVAIECETTNYAIAKKYWTEILSMQHRRGYDRVLIDKNVINSMAMPDVIMLVSELAHSGCHDVRFAICDRRYDPERCGFEEMVGTNRGLKVRISATMREALDWLAHESILAVPQPQARAAA